MRRVLENSLLGILGKMNNTAAMLLFFGSIIISLILFGLLLNYFVKYRAEYKRAEEFQKLQQETMQELKEHHRLLV